jgi:broad specificity phosphatase PhoE
VAGTSLDKPGHDDLFLEGIMPRLYLVRHGEAAATWADAADPGLSSLGNEQAEAAALALQGKGPLDLVSSPLARARETAEPLARLWRKSVAIAEPVAEIPSPGISLEQRRIWLTKIMGGLWADAGADLLIWRRGVVDYLTGLKTDTAIFSHFIAINVAVGAAIGRDEVVCFSPANGSITVLETKASSLKLIEKGAEASTIVR